MFYFIFAFRYFFPQVLRHNFCFLMYFKLFLVVVCLWELWPKQGCLFVALWLKVEFLNTHSLELDVITT
jgi:hypothetical protein